MKSNTDYRHRVNNSGTFVIDRPIKIPDTYVLWKASQRTRKKRLVETA